MGKQAYYTEGETPLDLVESYYNLYEFILSILMPRISTLENFCIIPNFSWININYVFHKT